MDWAEHPLYAGPMIVPPSLDPTGSNPGPGGAAGPNQGAIGAVLNKIPKPTAIR
jgi:hypothetical protein